MSEQINGISSKLKQLKKLDKSFSLFGASNHRYVLNPKLTINAIRQFETKHCVTLPDGYIEFLTEIGNGGAGPFYGLEPLQNVLYEDLDYKRPDSLLNPAKPFLHTEPWNIKFPTSDDENDYEEEYKDDEVYYATEQMNGVLAICNYGCGVSLNLVVNGQEYGNIWTDDRGSDNGIYPSNELGNKERIDFLNWYELWLDNSLSEIENKFPAYRTAVVVDQTKKPWWKFWRT